MSADGAFELVRHPLALRKVTVKHVRALTPRMVRVTLHGEALRGFTSLAPEDHVKVFFPRPGQVDPVTPTLGPRGLLLPTFGQKPYARDYTPLDFREDALELDIDFHLHGQGLAALWAETAKPGDRLVVAGPRGSHRLAHEYPWHLCIGDETALPEMLRRLSGLPAQTRALGLFLVEDDAERQPLPERLGGEDAAVRWVYRAQGGAEPLLEALRDQALPPGEGFIWVAGEARQVRAICSFLCAERGVAARRIRASGHWKQGVINHDHHEPIEMGGRA